MAPLSDASRKDRSNPALEAIVQLSRRLDVLVALDLGHARQRDRPRRLDAREGLERPRWPVGRQIFRLRARRSRGGGGAGRGAGAFCLRCLLASGWLDLRRQTPASRRIVRIRAREGLV